MQRDPRRQWTTRLAMVAGVLVGLWLLLQLRVEPPPVAKPEPVRADVRPDRPRPPARPAPRPRRPPPQAPVLAPLPEDEAAAEPVDTGEPPVELALVHLIAEDTRGFLVDDASIRVWGCQIRERRASDEGVELLIEVGQTCTAEAWRIDGLLRARAAPLEFDVDGDLEAWLVFPAERTGGIGVQFQPVDDGILVVAVMNGTPAALAGLRPGDRIVSVGGIPTTELDAQDFVDEMTGPEGSDVEFELEFDTDDGPELSTVTLTRQFLSG